MTVFDSETLEHPTTDELQALFSGGLGRLRREDVEAHLLECDQCCTRLDQLSSAEGEKIDHDPFVQLVREVEGDTDSWCDSLHDACENDHFQNDRQWHRSVQFFLADHPRYEIGERIGSGGMGVVFHAKHRMMRRNVVIKVINRRLMLDHLVAARFRREIRAAAHLSHPTIVAAHDSEEYRGLHFLVMEHVDGSNLDAVVKEYGTLSLDVAGNYICQAAEGLEHAFKRQMVHRDIKPQNLMLTPDGSIKILDFGLARFVSEETAESAKGLLGLEGEEGLSGSLFKVDGLTKTITRMGAVLGTLGYAAPEQLRDPQSVDIRADIYGLGAVLHFLLIGRPPRGIDAPELYGPPARARHAELENQKAPGAGYDHENGTEPEPGNGERLANGDTEITGFAREELPPEAIPILERMLAQDPDDRFQTPAEIVAAFSAVNLVAEPQGFGEAKSKTDPQASIQTRRNRRSRIPWTVLLVLVVAGAASYAIHLVMPSHPDSSETIGLKDSETDPPDFQNVPSPHPASAHSEPVAVTDGLVAWWPLDDVDGELVKDASGNGHDGQIDGTHARPGPANGRIGGALDFRAAHEFISIVPPVELSQQWTVAMWLRRSAWNRSSILLGAPDANALVLEQSKNSRIGIQIDGRESDFGIYAPPNEWMHVTFVCSDTDTTLYGDGHFVRAKRLTCPLVISQLGDSTRGRLSATLDEIRVYDRALHASEVAQLAVARKVPATKPDIAETVSTQPIDIDVLANDFHADHSTLRVTSISVPLTSFRSATQDGTLAPGWAFYWNAPTNGDSATGLIGDASAYQPLEYRPDDGQAWHVASHHPEYGMLQLTKEGGRPGTGWSDPDSEANTLDRYVIAGFEVPVAGDYSITSSSLFARQNPGSNGVSLRIYAADRVVLIAHCERNTTRAFDTDLGRLKAGDQIRVAIGPRGRSEADEFQWDFQINGPSNETSSQSELGATVSINSNGTIHYDPTTSAILNSLPPTESQTDRFTCTVTDPHGTRHVSSVEIAITGND